MTSSRSDTARRYFATRPPGHLHPSDTESDHAS
jgi:hypothetical protein